MSPPEILRHGDPDFMLAPSSQDFTPFHNRACSWPNVYKTRHAHKMIQNKNDLVRCSTEVNKNIR